MGRCKGNYWGLGGQIWIGRIVSYSSNAPLIMDGLFTPKTQTSKRKIDLGPTVIKELKKWRLACPKNDLDLVFPNEAGNHINNKNMLRRHFRPALQAAAVPPSAFTISGIPMPASASRRGKHQIHPDPTWTRQSHHHPQCVCPPNERPKSEAA